MHPGLIAKNPYQLQWQHIGQERSYLNIVGSGGTGQRFEEPPSTYSIGCPELTVPKGYARPKVGRYSNKNLRKGLSLPKKVLRQFEQEVWPNAFAILFTRLCFITPELGLNYSGRSLYWAGIRMSDAPTKCCLQLIALWIVMCQRFNSVIYTLFDIAPGRT